jgi:hypothetical protein
VSEPDSGTVPSGADTVARLRTALLVGAVGVIFLLCLEVWFASHARGGIYFQRWSSEALQQTVSIEDLRDEPVRSLWNLHIQPPALDAIRALLAKVWSTPDSRVLLERVDRSLLLSWAFLFGLLGASVFWWVSERTARTFAVGVALAFYVHPAAIFYATLLDGTFLTALLQFGLVYLLWRLKAGLGVSMGLLALAYLALFFTRSLYFWPWLFVLAACLLLLRLPARRIAVFIAIAGTVVAFYTVKQYLLFGLTATSSFTGYNLTQSIDRGVDLSVYAAGFPKTDLSASGRAKVLRRVDKLTSEVEKGRPDRNYNHERYLAVNRELVATYRSFLAAASPFELGRLYAQSLRLYLQPSSRYTPHVIVDRLPWRAAYDRIFSWPVLSLLVLLGGAIWLARSSPRDYPAAAAVLLPVLACVTASVVGDRGENMRFKFFVEPILLVFFAMQLHSAAAWLKARPALGRLVRGGPQSGG